jgi:hypothetical protein
VWSPDYAGPSTRPPASGGEPGFHTAISSLDRHQIVQLSSDYLNLTVPSPVNFEVRRRSRYVPAPGVADTWLLSTLGAWLRQGATWGGNAKATRPADAVSTISLSGWGHVATQGRDHWVKIVREGSLFPFWHRATAVTITERWFETGGGGPPVARLRQYEFILVREHIRSYTTARYANQGRENPFRQSIQITTAVTPHVLMLGATGPAGVTSGVAGAPMSFWTLTLDGQPFRFQMIGVDADGHSSHFEATPIFVPDEDATAGGIRHVRDAYVADLARRRCPVPDQSLAYAPSSQPGRRDGALSTQGLLWDAQVNDLGTKPASAESLPKLAGADVRIDALNAMLGGNASVAIKLYEPYLKADLDPHAGVFAELAKPPRVDVPPGRAGGIAAPSIGVTAIGRATGIVSGDPAHATTGQMDPKQVFSLPDAKLFGAISLKDLIGGGPGGGLVDAAAAPQVSTAIEPTGDGGRRGVTSLKWSAELHDQPIFKTHGTRLEVQGRIEQLLPAVGAAPTSPTSTFTGSINDFDVELAGVIVVKFTSFSFNATTGRKTDVNVALVGPDPSPIAFIGALSFVNTLADIIPPGLFGPDGPSIEINPAGIVVGYTLGLPDISIGVFSLQHLSLGAELTLPFLSGKPQLAFSFASREHPFLLTVECFGGGGFVRVTVDAGGPIAVEAALEFGGALALDIGVASGGVSVMAGIYFKLSAEGTDLLGFVDIHGEVTVLGLVSVSVDFNLTLGYKHGKAYGSASMSVSIHIACFSKGVTLQVERSFGGGAGDPKMGQLISASAWASYAEAFA